MPTEKQIVEALRDCYDPEIPVNVVDLGLIYGVRINRNDIKIKMTLTSPHCPLAGMIVENVKKRIKAIKNVENVEVDLVFDPPWSPDRMSGKIKKQHGF